MNPSLTWPATCSSMSVTTWPLAQPWKGMSAARMTARVSANSCRHISRAVCRSRVTFHVPRVPATHLALLLLEVGPLLLLLGLQHHLGTRHLLALPRPAATIRYDDIRSDQVSVVLHRLVASLCLRVKASKILSVQTSSRLGLCSIVNLSRALHHLTIIITTNTMEPHLEQMTLTMAWLEKQ